MSLGMKNGELLLPKGAFSRNNSVPSLWGSSVRPGREHQYPHSRQEESRESCQTTTKTSRSPSIQR